MMHSALPPQVHIRAVQPSAVEPHELPHEPQLLVSVVTLVHEPPQQSSAPEQVLPHAPQFATPVSAVQRPLQQA